MIETVKCELCGWRYAPSLTAHNCKYTPAKQLLLNAKMYLIFTYGLEHVPDEFTILSEAHLAVIREENRITHVETIVSVAP